MLLTKPLEYAHKYDEARLEEEESKCERKQFHDDCHHIFVCDEVTYKLLLLPVDTNANHCYKSLRSEVTNF